jgi:hypothetical protein
MAAASAATGFRSWLQTHNFTWLTPRRLRQLTIAAMCAAGLVSTIGFSGSTPATGAASQPPATAGKIVSSAPSATGVARPSKKRMSSPAR